MRIGNHPTAIRAASWGRPGAAAASSMTFASGRTTLRLTPTSDQSIGRRQGPGPGAATGLQPRRHPGRRPEAPGRPRPRPQDRHRARHLHRASRRRLVPAATVSGTRSGSRWPAWSRSSTVWSAKRGPSTAGMSALTADHDIRRPATYDPAAANSPQSAAAHPTSAWRSASVKASRSALSTSSVPTTVPVPGSTTGTIASDSVLVNAVR